MKIQRVLAPNPGIFTGTGTNAWVGSTGGEAVIVDPGPLIESHRKAILETLGGLDPVAVLVTHCHPDHVPAANPLAAELGVPALGGCPGPGFKPDRLLVDGDRIEVGDAVVEAIHTPGHTPFHFCFRVDASLFTGDHVLGGTTVIVEHMSEYMESLEKLRGTGLKRLFPGHGPIIRNPDAVLTEYLEHRWERERQILEALDQGAATIGQVVERVYAAVDPALWPLAARSVGAHLRKLVDEGRVTMPYGTDDWSSPVEVVTEPTGKDQGSE
jgi:glyoxylase-like metal-dependent hydrolase (beta-lactamase superfamily II)